MKNRNIMRTKFLALGLLAGASSMMAQKPNIILIMTDQQRGDAMGCMGNEHIITPTLDQLASDGYLYTNGYASAPSSTPSRAALLTGMSPYHHGMLGYGKMAPQYKYEKAQMLKDLEYYTFAIGKMHYAPQMSQRGYNITLLDESGRSESEGFVSDYRKWLQLTTPGTDPDLTGIGWNDHRASEYKLDESQHPTTWTANTAIEFINNYNNEQPLFLKVSFARPHSPYDPPQRYLDMYDNVDIPAPAIGDWAEKWSTPKKPEADYAAPVGNFGEEYAINSRKHYYAAITFIDSKIAEIIQALKDNNMYDNTLICFISDHGDMMGDHYHWRKTYPYEGSVNVPFIVKLPANDSKALPKGTKIEQPVEIRDVLPTFLDAAGSSVPDDMDGRSLITLAHGETKDWREFIDLEHATAYWRDNCWVGLTDGKIKYAWYYLSGEEVLFDLVKDPHELKEVSSSKAYKKQLEYMRQKMVEHLTERGDSFVKDGKLVVRKESMLYSPNFPKQEK